MVGFITLCPEDTRQSRHHVHVAQCSLTMVKRLLGWSAFEANCADTF